MKQTKPDYMIEVFQQYPEILSRYNTDCQREISRIVKDVERLEKEAMDARQNKEIIERIDELKASAYRVHSWYFPFGEKESV